MPFGFSVAPDAFPSDDVIVIAGEASPGLATVKNLGVASTFDIRKGYGFSGATTIYTGEDVPKFDVEFQFWRPEQYTAWKAYAKRYLSKPTRSPVPGQILALGIKHDVVNAEPYGIDKVVRLSVSGIEQDDTGLWTVTVGFLKYMPAILALAKPNGAIPAVSKVAPTPRDAVEVQIEQLRATRDGLLGG